MEINLNFASQSTFICSYMEKQNEDLKVIREMMEKSTKFLSLSGLSGVSAGITALIGGLFAYFYITKARLESGTLTTSNILYLSFGALSVLIVAFCLAIYFSRRKAHKRNQKLMNKATLYTLYNLAIPLITGGIISLIMILRGTAEFVVPITLIFYGLALVNASKYTFEEVHYLGITEIVIGLLAAVFVNNGLIFWILGFGVCHILYGIILYRKYERK